MNNNANNDCNTNNDGDNKDKIIQSDNSVYDKLNIYDIQDTIMINFIYDVSYLNYKKKIFETNIKIIYNLISNFVDTNIFDILINIHILKKKNKLSIEQFSMLNEIYLFVEKINKIVFIDQENIFLILIDFYKINNLCSEINAFFENYIFKELVDYKMLINKIKETYFELKNKSELFEMLEIFSETGSIEYLDEKNNNEDMKKIISKFVEKISFDLFMFYNSKSVFNILQSSFTKSGDTKYNDKNKIESNLLEINKTYFIQEYSKFSKKYIEIYSNDIELYIKFKVKKNELITKLVESLEYIDKIK